MSSLRFAVGSVVPTVVSGVSNGMAAVQDFGSAVGEAVSDVVQFAYRSTTEYVERRTEEIKQHVVEFACGTAEWLADSSEEAVGPGGVPLCIGCGTGPTIPVKWGVEWVQQIDETTEAEDWRWRDFWNTAKFVSAVALPPSWVIGEAFTSGLGDVAMAVETLTGGDCFWDAVQRMWVCWGGSMIAGRGGTTWGDAFISRMESKDGEPRDPRTLDEQRYADLMEHEGNHRAQYEVFGPGMATYFLFEGLGAITGADPACLNPFEWSANWEQGGYEC